MLDPEIVQTYAVPKKPFQGWRYLKKGNIPADRGIYQGKDAPLADLPPDLEADLIASGLL
jgi:hypothetical protein